MRPHHRYVRWVNFSTDLPINGLFPSIVVGAVVLISAMGCVVACGSGGERGEVCLQGGRLQPGDLPDGPGEARHVGGGQEREQLVRGHVDAAAGGRLPRGLLLGPLLHHPGLLLRLSRGELPIAHSPMQEGTTADPAVFSIRG